MALQKNPIAAEAADLKIEETIDLLEGNPFLGKENHKKISIRTLIIKSLSLNVYYQEAGGIVRILRILHQSRNIKKLIE